MIDIGAQIMRLAIIIIIFSVGIHVAGVNTTLERIEQLLIQKNLSQ